MIQSGSDDDLKRRRQSGRKIIYTINSDASYDDRTKTGAYAYYIRGDNFHVKASGVLGEVPNSNVAELLSFEKALRRLDDVVEDRRKVRLVVNIDNRWVIHGMMGIAKQGKYIQLIRAVKQSAKYYQLDMRHVKAHTHTADPRHWVNDWCDRMAKLALKTELSKNGG